MLHEHFRRNIICVLTNAREREHSGGKASVKHESSRNNEKGIWIEYLHQELAQDASNTVTNGLG